MKLLKITALLTCATALSGCLEMGEGFGQIPADKSIDRGINAHHLSTLKAGVWIDPEGCDHWIVDDGVEGYLSARLDDQGRPICSGAGLPNTAVGPFKKGSPIPDIL